MKKIQTKKTVTTKKAAPKKKGGRGFASMESSKQREIASRGGKAVSQNREHMADIGRKGGRR